MAGDTYVADLSEGTLVDATFAVQRKQRRHTRNGDPFLSMELADRTGRVPGVVWNDVNLLGARFDQGDTVRVLGRVESYGGRLQIAVRDLEKVDAGDPLDLVPGARRDAETLDGLRRVPGRRDRPPGPARAARPVPGRRALPRAAALGARGRDAPRLRRRPARAHGGGGDALPRGGAAASAPELRPADHRGAAARRRPHRDVPARRHDRRVRAGPPARTRARRRAHDRRRRRARWAWPTTCCCRS